MLKKKTNYEVETVASCLTDVATGDAGAVAVSTFANGDVEISNDYNIPFHAICAIKVKKTTEEVEVDDPTCQGNTPPTPKPTIIGVDDTTINQFDAFDPMEGVSATDYEGNPVPVTVSGSVNTEVPGTYTLTYTATDSEGVTATARRRVKVEAVANPVIVGVDDVSIVQGTSFNPMDGVSATDYQGNSVPVTVEGTVDVDEPGAYTLTYTATDSHGKTTTATRVVTVIETDAPIINGANDVTINQGIGIDLTEGVTATYEGNPIEFTYSPQSIEACDVGSHTVTYSATGGSKTTTVERVVTIEQVSNPVISGLSDLTVEVNEEFDPLDGVSAVDGNGKTVEVTVVE